MENQHTQSSIIEISDPAVLSIMPVVSVLMITYNHGQYIADAIEGVLAQSTDFPIELIIGEDCSADNTRAIVLDYQRRYPKIIRVIYSTKNVGAFKNNLRTFARARGEFTAYCEGDDYWHEPLKLQRQVYFLKANLGHGLVHSDYDRLLYSFGTWKRIKFWNRRKYKVMPQGEIYSDLLKRMFIGTCTMTGRTSLMQQHYNSRLNSPDNPVGDWPLVLHMSRLGKVGYIDSSMATYRRTPGSMMNAGLNTSVKLQKRLLTMVQSFAEEFGTGGADAREYLQIRYRRILKLSLRAKSRADFYFALEWLQRNSPRYAGSPKVTIWKALIRTDWPLDWYLYLSSFLYETSLLFRLIKKNS